MTSTQLWSKDLHRSAVFDHTKKYRYLLKRWWGEKSNRVVFILLNPSTADETQDDPTIRRCMGFASYWGYTSADILNIFALRSTDPAALYSTNSPIGASNDAWIDSMTMDAKLVVAAWGNHGLHLQRGSTVRFMIRERRLACFGLTRTKEPKHPLYLSGRASLFYMKPDGSVDTSREVSHEH